MQYLYTDVNKQSLSNYTRIRINNYNLNIEKGRYLHLHVEKRICHLCHEDIEDEFHFIMKCGKLIKERGELFKKFPHFLQCLTKINLFFH